MLLSREFVLLIGVAFVVAIPLAYLLLDAWLNGFAFRVSIAAWPFILSGVVVFVVAMLTIGFHAYRATLINPSDTLKYE